MRTETLPLFKPLSHSADPQTSFDAVEKLAKSGKLKQQRAMVWAAIQKYPFDDFTAEELNRKFPHLGYPLIQRRLSEIPQIQHNGKRRNGYAVWERKY